MTTTPAPRIRRPSWRDPRLGVGILLVVGSVALGSWVVSQANHTVEAYVADGVLTPGETISVADLRPVAVTVPDLEGTYLTPASPPPEGAIVVRTIHSGEMVPIASLGTAEDVEVRTVTVPIESALGATVAPGDRVDLWVGGTQDSLGSDPAPAQPQLLVGAVEVAAVNEDTSLFAGAGTMQAHLLVPQEELPAVLGAIGSEATITVVPIPGGGS